ncbi:hypothetical protein MBANPS3_003268 [Mucor bainieri]
MSLIQSVGFKCPTCNQIIDKTRNSPYLRIQLSNEIGSGSSRAVSRDELKKNLMESMHKVLTLETELSNTKDKLSQACSDREVALAQVRNHKDMVRGIAESMQSLERNYQQVTDARDNCLVELESVKLCNQTLINELKESQKLYNTLVNKELHTLRLKKEKCSSCEKKPLNSIGPSNTTHVSDNHNYRLKYLDLQKQHSDLLEKEQILEKKFVELTVSANDLNVVTNDGLASQMSYHHQVNDSTSRENRLLIDISRLKQSKDKMYKEKRHFQDRYNATNMQLKETQRHNEALLDKIKVLQYKLKASDESVSLLQQIKQDWEDENQPTKEKLRLSLGSVKKLQELNQKYATEIAALHEKMIVSEQMMQAFQENELLVSKELDEVKSLLESSKITNDDLTSEVAVLKEKLATATRSWFY